MMIQVGVHCANVKSCKDVIVQIILSAITPRIASYDTDGVGKAYS